MPAQTLIPLRDKIAVLDKSYQYLEKFIKKRLLKFTVYDEGKAEKLKKEIFEKISRQDKINRLWAGLNIPLAYNQAATEAKEILEKFGAKIKKKRFDLVSTQSKKNGTVRLVSYMDTANKKIKETVTQYFDLLKKANQKAAALQNLQLQNLVNNQEILKGTEEIIKASMVPVERITKAGFTYLATPSRIEVSRDIEKLFKKVFGDFDFISITMKNGKIRNYKPGSYIKMLTRTETRAIQTQAVKDRCREYQNDLVTIPPHDDPCPICKPYQGQIFSLSGKHTIYPPAIPMPIHPNCEDHYSPTSEEAIANEKKFGKVFPEPYRGSVQETIELARKSKLKIPLKKTIDSKEAIIQSLKNAGIKNVYIENLNDVGVLKIIENQMISLSKEYRPNAALRAWGMKGDAYAAHKLGGINLNPEWFNDSVKLKNAILEGIKSGFHVKRISENEAIKSIITHEFAHDLTSIEIFKKSGLYKELNKIRLDYRKKLRSLRSELEKKAAEIINKEEFNKFAIEWRAEWDKNYISQYASKSLDEFVAEAFTDYKHGISPSPFSINVGNAIDLKYKKGGS